MKKIVLYVLAAAILGILVTVVPLVTIAQIGVGGNTQKPATFQSLGQGLRQLDGGYGSNNQTVTSSDIAVFAISFIIALLAYALVGHRAPRRYNLRLGVPPY